MNKSFLSGGRSLFFIRCMISVLVLAPHPASAIQAVVSKALFFAPDEADKRVMKPYIELSWEINPATISWLLENGSYSGKVITAIEASNDSGVIYRSTYALQTGKLTDKEQITSVPIIDLRRFFAAPGNIKIALRLTDANRQDQTYSYTDSLTVAIPESAFLSDLQLLDTILPAAAESPFEKNGVIQIPKNDNFIPDGKKGIIYYAEIYQPGPSLSPMLVKTFISRKGGGGAIYDLTRTDTATLQQTQAISGGFSTAKLGSGNYLLNMQLTDMQRQVISFKQLFFQVENKNPEKAPALTIKDTVANGVAAVNVVDLSKMFVSKYTPQQIRAILKMLRPISEPTERNTIDEFLRKPDDMYSRYFIINFWKARNPLQPEDAWKAYSDKVKEVNKLFASGSTGGYETDRGAVWLTYGKPNERIIAENESGALPYELWVYDYLPRQTGKGMFLFYRPGSMISDFKLLHSTVSGSLRNTAWRNALYPNGRSENSVRSRADEYLENR